MTAKEYLGQAYRIDQRIKSKLEQVLSLRDLSTKATSTLTDMPHNTSPNHRSMVNIIDKMADLEKEINSDIETLVNLKKDIVSKIKGVEDPEHSTLLELRYLCFKPWEKISLEMGYDLRWIYRMHQKALGSIKLSKT